MAQSFNLTARINLTGPFNLRPIVSKIKKDIGSINPSIKFKLDPAAAKSVAKVTSEIKKLDSATKNAQKSVGSLNSQLLTLSSSFNAAAAASQNAANAAANVGKATASTAKSVNQARTSIEEFGKQSGLAIKRFAAFTSVTTVIFGITNALASAYKEFLVFNREIVRLSQVTGKSVGDLTGINNEITRLSTSLGVASSDLVSVTTTLAQAGLSAEDTKVALEALAKATLAPTFKDIQNTTEGAIAAIRQFGLETRELDGALGSINAVAAAFAVEADDIVAAIQRTGGVFASTSRGVSEGADALNEFIAIFTSVRQTTRESAETIATGLRTIFTRIQRSSTIELLKQYGVELRDLEGKFVGPFEAVKRLSEGLSGIDPRSADFAKISEELGGFRQIGKVIPLIQQFAVAQDALNVAQRGSGSLTKDAVLAQQSLAVQFTKTRESFLALVRDVGEGKSFKVFVGTALTLTNGLISLGQALKPLLPLLLTFGAIKIGSSINQFLSGFGLAFNRGGAGPAGGAGGTSTTPPSGRGGGGGNQPLTAALALNTTATNALVQTLGTLNTTVSSLNQNIILLVNRPSPPGFASGGLVPGSGNRDTVRANLTPGEFVIRKKAVESIGINNLARMNKGGKATSKKSRAYVFDFDDTLAESDAKVREGAIDPFVDFRGERAANFIRGARATRYADMAKKRASEGYDIHVLTARPSEPDTLSAIQEFMSRSIGSQAKSIIGVGGISESMGGTANAKAAQLEKLKAFYDQVVFLDDDLENVLKARAISGVKSRIARKNNGGLIQKFNLGSMGRGVKGRRGTRSKFRELTQEELSKLSAAESLEYGKRLAYDIFTTAGAGIATSSEFVEVPKERIIPELEPYLVSYLGKKGFWKEKVSPFAQAKKSKIIKDTTSRESALQNQVSKQADEVAARSQQWTSIRSGSSIDNYLLSSLTDPILSDYKSVRQGSSLSKPFHNTRLRQAVNKALDSFDDFDYSPGNIDALVSRMAAKRFAYGGIVRQYNRGTTGRGVKELTEEEENLLNRLRSSGLPRGNFGTLSSKQLFSLKSLDSRSFDSFSTQTGIQKTILQKLWAVGRERQGIEKQQTAEEAQKARLSELAKKQEALIDNKVIDFGLVGLRYGSGKPETTSTFTIPKPPGFETSIENIRNLPESSQLVRVLSSTVSEKAGPETAENIQNILMNKFKESVISTATTLGSKIGTGISPDMNLIDKAINNSDFFNVIGAGLEASIGSLGSPIIPKTQGSKSIDFPKGLGSQTAEFFGIPPNIPTDVTRTIGGEGKSLGSSGYLGQIQRWFNSEDGKRYLTKFQATRGFAYGGNVSGEDTVPALLTPGEFVFNKESAQRIGYGNLNRLNKADKIQGFNKGGVVGPQRFATGGSVTSDSTLIGAALASVLLPEIQKLASAFGKLEGSVGDFGTALSGAVRESSSIILSAGIGLRAVGASSKTIAAAQIGGGLAAGIGGALTDTSSKLLERALLDNTQALGKFNKSLQDFTNAPTEELKIEAAAQVEKNFVALDQTLQNTKQNIDNLENIKNLGQSITNVNLTILSTVTAVQALSAASKQAALTVANARLAQAGQTIAVSAGTRLLAKFGSAIPVIGSFIAIGSVALETFSFFSTKLKSTDDQFNQLNQALRETIKISNNYNLANENFLNNILPLYRELRDRTKGGTNDAVSEIGSLRSTQLNLTRDFLIRNLATRAGVGVRSTESIQQAQQRLRSFPELAKRLEDAIVKANIRYIREGFAEALRAQGVTDPKEIQARAQQLGGFDSAAVRQIASQFFGEQDRRLLAERDLAEASRNLQTNLINLTNTVTNLESIFNKSLSNLTNSFDDLNQDIDVLTGSFKITGGIGVGRDIQVLENLKQATPEIISGVLQKLAPFIGDPSRGTPEEAKIFNEIVDAIQAYSALQKTTDILLNKIAQENLTSKQSESLLQRELKPILIKSLGGGEEADKKANTLIGELGSAIESANIAGQPLVSLKDAGSKAAAFGTLLSQLESTAQGAVTALKSLEKAQQLQAENISRRIELEQKFNELALQKQQTEIRNNLELKRILGQRISLEETNAEFLAEISSRSEKSGVPLQIIGGQITSEQVSLIAQELEKTKNDLIRRNQQLRKAGQGGNGLEQLDSVSIRLSKKGQNLQKVLELLATSGILVKNAFENISKTQDLFKSQDQLEFELLRDFGDPTKAFDLTETLRAIEAVRAGTADIRQAQIAAEKGPDLLRRATGEESAEQFAVLARETYRALIPLITEEQRLAKENLDKYRTAEKQRIEELKQTTQQEQAAFNALLKANADALSFSTGNITKIFDGFAPQVKTAWEGLISTILTIQNRVQEQAKITENVRRISESSQQEAIFAVASLTAPGNVNLPLGPGGKRLSYTRPSVLSEARAEETFSIISTGDAKQIIKELERLRRDIIQSPDTFLGPDRTTREARANQVLGPILRDLNQQQDQQLKQVPTRPPTREQLGIPFGELEGFLNKLKTEVNKLDLNIKIPSFDFSLSSTDSSTLNRFSSSIQSLSTALVADDGNINNLASAVNSLAPVTNDLKTAITELGKLFKDGKIQLDQQANANVNVTFENGIPLETESGLDSKIASNIQALLNTTLDQKFSSLIRTLLG